MHVVGRVQRIYRYPVKSMAAEPLARCSLGWNGLEGDRRFAFSRVGNASGFPWLTGRNLRNLIRYRPYFTEPEAQSGTGLRVITPDGEEVELSSPELRDQIAAAYGGDVELIHVDRGIFDEAHVSVISTDSIHAVQEEASTFLDERRFRPNLLIATRDSAPFSEEEWVGRVLTFGEGSDAPSVSVTHRDKRCVMINLDPETAEADANVLKTVVRARSSCVGVYGAVVRTGVIEEGSLIFCNGPDESVSD